MTVTVLCVAFLLPVGSIAHTMWREVVTCQTEADLGVDGEHYGRLTAPLPEPRTSWPQRQTPSDVPARVGLVVAQDREALSTTGQFWVIVDNSLAEPCTHCSAPEDGEPAHAGCPGCSCWCSLVEAMAAP